MCKQRTLSDLEGAIQVRCVRAQQTNQEEEETPPSKE